MTTMVLDERRILAELTVTAGKLRGGGDREAIETLNNLCISLGRVLEPIQFVSEEDAMVLTGQSRRWLRGRHGTWMDMGSARIHDGVREYRKCALPMRGTRRLQSIPQTLSGRGFHNAS